MNVTLIQYPEHDVDREDSAKQQKALVRDRILEGLGVARKGGRQPGGKFLLVLQLVDARQPRRRARRRPKVERQVTAGSWPSWFDRQ